MARVALVRVPPLLPAFAIRASECVPAIGVAYLAGSLKAAGHAVNVVDAYGEAVHTFRRLGDTGLLVNGLIAPEVVERIPDDVDVIGVSCMFSNEWIYAKDVIRAIGDRFPRVPIIAGGEHLTADPEYSLRSCPALRCAVLGEGEETLTELVAAFGGSMSLSKVNGLAYVTSDGAFVTTPPRARIRNVDDIPLPSWEESPLETYLSNGLGMASTRGRNMPMIASRGCPYRCTFCSNPVMWTQRWIARNPRLVVQEMKTYIDKYGVTHIEFYDLTTIIRREWILEFTERLLREKLPVTWALPSGTRSEALDAEVLARLKATGCHELNYAPESGSPRTLKRIKKEVKLPKMLASMRAAVRAGITIKTNMIVGFPRQTLGEVAESYLFTLKLAWAGVHDVAMYPFVPYPGSELFTMLVREGRIPRDGAEYERFLAGNVYNELTGMRSWSEYFSDWQIKYLTVGGMIWFYFWQYLFRPWRAVRSAYRVMTGRPKTMMERTVDGILQNFVKGRKRGAAEVVGASIPRAPTPTGRPQAGHSADSALVGSVEELEDRHQGGFAAAGLHERRAAGPRRDLQKGPVEARS